MRALFSWLLCVALSIGASNCAHSKPQLALALEPTVNSNRGRALYVLARAVTEQQYATQDYRTVAALVQEPDSSVRATIVVLPGRASSATVRVEASDRIAIYGFFSDVGGVWRLLLDAGTTSVRLRVSDNTIEVMPHGS